MNEPSKRSPVLSFSGHPPDGHLRIMWAVSRVARRIYGKNWTDIERPRLEAAKLRSKMVKAMLARKAKEERSLALKLCDAEARAEKVWPKGEPYYRRAQAIVLGWLAKGYLTAFEGVVPITPSFWSGSEASYVIEHGYKPMKTEPAYTMGQKYEPFEPPATIAVDATELGALLKKLKPIAEGASEEVGGESGDESDEAKAPGRPSLQIEIEKACNKLIASEKINLDSRKPNYEPIRQIIRRERGLPPGGYIGGLGDEAIRKVIAPILDNALAALNEAKTASH